MKGILSKATVMYCCMVHSTEDVRHNYYHRSISPNTTSCDPKKEVCAFVMKCVSEPQNYKLKIHVNDLLNSNIHKCFCFLVCFCVFFVTITFYGSWMDLIYMYAPDHSTCKDHLP